MGTREAPPSPAGSAHCHCRMGAVSQKRGHEEVGFTESLQFFTQRQEKDHVTTILIEESKPQMPLGAR